MCVVERRGIGNKQVVSLVRQTRKRKKECNKAKDETSATTNAAAAKNTETVHAVEAKDDNTIAATVDAKFDAAASTQEAKTTLDIAGKPFVTPTKQRK